MGKGGIGVIVWLLLFLGLTLPYEKSEAAVDNVNVNVNVNVDTSSSVYIVGVVFCDQCHQQRLTHNSIFLPGSSVSINCIASRMNTNHSSHINLKAKIDKYGQVMMKLPPGFSTNNVQDCKLDLVKSPFKECNIFSQLSTTNSFIWVAKHEDADFYTFGAIAITPKVVPNACNSQSRLSSPLSLNTYLSSSKVSKSSTINPNAWPFSSSQLLIPSLPHNPIFPPSTSAFGFPFFNFSSTPICLNLLPSPTNITICLPPVLVPFLPPNLTSCIQSTVNSSLQGTPLNLSACIPPILLPFIQLITNISTILAPPPPITIVALPSFNP